MGSLSILKKLHILRPPKRADADWECSPSTEILEKIFGYLDEERKCSPVRVSFTREVYQPTLRSAQLVCRVWNASVAKYLYEDIYISSPDSLERLFRTLRKCEDFRPLVHHLDFSGRIYRTGMTHPFTRVDAFHFWSIHELCPNLSALQSYDPRKTYPFNDVDAFCRLHKFDRGDLSRLTSMSLSMPNRVLFGEQMIFPPEYEFSALETLFIRSSWHSDDPSTDESTPHWFRMPGLRRLCLRGFKIRSWQRITFPDSPLHTIELLGGDFTEVDYLFDRFASPLYPLRKTLQNLTITAIKLGHGGIDYNHESVTDPLQTYLICEYGQSTTKWSMGFLENLEQLTLPFRSFARIQIASYPPRLKNFAISGYAMESYRESPEEQEHAYRNMMKFLTDIQYFGGPRGLKTIQVIVKGLQPSIFLNNFDAHVLGIDIDLEFRALRRTDTQLDLMNVRWKRWHLK